MGLVGDNIRLTIPSLLFRRATCLEDPPEGVQVFPSPHMSADTWNHPTSYTFCPSSRWKVMSCFGLRSSDYSWVWTSLSVLILWLSPSVTWSFSYWSSCPFSYWLVGISSLFWISVLVGFGFCKYILSTCHLSIILSRTTCDEQKYFDFNMIL